MDRYIVSNTQPDLVIAQIDGDNKLIFSPIIAWAISFGERNIQGESPNSPWPVTPACTISEYEIFAIYNLCTSEWWQTELASGRGSEELTKFLLQAEQQKRGKDNG